ncbi:MAG: hypothetical protein WD052_01105 [Bacteroidales bacterium]
MKKTLLIFVAIVFAVTACNKQTYVDGTYTVTFNEPSHSYTGFVTVTLAEDAITDVDFDYMNDTIDLRKSEDDAYKQRMLDRGMTTSPDEFIPLIEASLQAATIIPEFVPIDAVTGATSSSNDANYLMEIALDNAITGETTNDVVPYPVEE